MKAFNVIVTACFCCFMSSEARHSEQAVLQQGDLDDHRTAPLSIAVIGAGAAGASSAYHLAQFASDASLDLDITVFDRNDYIGGRSITVDAYDDPSLPVELGASIFVEINSILSGAAKEFNLTTSGFGNQRAAASGSGLGIWNGQEFVLTQSAGSSWWDSAKILWKYGLAPIKTMKLVKATIGKFLAIYEAENFPFESITQVVQDLGLSAATAATGEQFLQENGIGGLFGSDVVQASTRVNYAQNMPFIHGLEAMVCMATEGAMSVEGGNYQIFERMVAASNATVHLETAVTGLEKQTNGSYVLKYRSNDTNTLSAESLYDTVILAAPHQFANITSSIPKSQIPDQIPYVQLHVTLLTSPHPLNPTFFNLKPTDGTPQVILTTLPPNETPLKGPSGAGSPGFFSISTLSTLTNPQTGQHEYLYKIFSPAAPNGTFLSQLLGLQDSDSAPCDNDITWIYRKIWHSYPYEYPRVTFENVLLEEGLWYTSGFESVISTMETSALMGKNVARLVVDTFAKSGGSKRVPG
ncbi:hypothetical protein MBLNU230_g3576t1 [Neophaeotheca triangularis]